MLQGDFMNQNDMEIKESFYLSEVLYGLKTQQEWSLYEIKMILMLLSKISDYRVYIKKTDNIIDINDDIVLDQLKNVPMEYKLSKTDFMNFTNIRHDNLAREIKKTCFSLLSKVIDTPNPLRPNDTKSFKMFTWFTDANYKDDESYIILTVNKETLKRLAVFTRYATITFQYIAPLKNKHSLSLYLVCKILQSQHYSNKVLKLSINELKAKLGLEKKYVKVTQLKEYVLDVVSSEINDKTDLVFDYELHKTGKRFTDITLKFSQKKDISKQLDQPKRQPQEIEHQASDAPLNLDVNDQDIIIAAQLQSYGIPRNKALEYVTTYGVDTCKIGIEKLLGEIQKGRDIKNISGYLVSCIENAGNNSSSQEIKAAMDAEEKIKQDRKNQELVRFNEFDEYIYNNREPIATLLLRHQEKEKLIDDVEIDMLRCLKRIVNEYDDLASIHPYYLKLKFKDDFINYEKIQSVVDELEVASKEERIAKLKTDLEAKKAELEGVSGKAKGLVEKEITMLKVAIADLV